MKRCLICAGLITAMLGGGFGDAVPRAEAQVVVAPANPNALSPQQRQVIRRMMRRRRHHRHRHKIPVAPAVPAVSMIPNPGMQNAMPWNPMAGGRVVRRHRGHHHRHHRYQWMMAQMMMRRMMLYQMLQAQGMPNQFPVIGTGNPVRGTPAQNVTAQPKGRVAAKIRQGIL